MKGNYKRSKRHSRMVSQTFRLGAVLAVAFVAVIVNLLASSSCTQLVKCLAEKDAKLKQCETDLDRACARWDAMRASSNLEHALVKRGIAMYTPGPNQIIRMDVDGRVLPGQTSVALARQRFQGGATAQISSQASRRGSRH